MWYASWPYRAAPLLIAVGLAVRLLPLGKRWADGLAHGAVTAGVVMLVQALALELYASHTAWSHDLPWPLPDLLAGIAALLGIDATASGSSVVMHSMRQVHRLGATWELLLDPATLLFFVGGLTMLAMREGGRRNEEGGRNDERSEGANDGSVRQLILSLAAVRHLPPSSFPFSPWSAWIRAARTLSLIVLCWLPLRAGLMMAVYLQRVLRSDPDRPLHAMNHFFSPWMLLALLMPCRCCWHGDSCGQGRRRKAEGGG